MSGLDHEFEAVGVRQDNIVLVLSGAKDLGLREKDGGSSMSPRFKWEVWCRDALLRMYDVSAVLEREGMKVDLLLFENRLTQGLPPDADMTFGRIDSWVAQHKLPKDWMGNWFGSTYPVELPLTRFLADAASSSGACYFGLNDLSLQEISAICGDDNETATAAAGETFSRVRVDQYFNPPTDELLLTALALSPRRDSAIVTDVYGAAVSLAHTPVSNVLVPQTDYSDPVATGASSPTSAQSNTVLKSG